MVLQSKISPELFFDKSMRIEVNNWKFQCE